VEPELMFPFLAADPGAWHIIGWILVLSAVGGVVLWVVTTLLLRDGSTGVADESRPERV
jgi:hypothetical protein